MILTIFLILALAAIIATIVHAFGKCPLWIGVMFLCIIELLRAGIPLGK